MTPRERATDQQPQRPDPEHGKSPTQLGMFTVLVEVLGASILLAIGIRFIAVPEQPVAVAWVLFILAAALIIDCARRLTGIARGRAPE